MKSFGLIFFLAIIFISCDKDDSCQTTPAMSYTFEVSPKDTVYNSNGTVITSQEYLSPDHDAVNDYWEMDLIGVTSAEVEVYNECGELLETITWNPNTTYIAWDSYVNGDIIPEGVYEYKLTALDGSGNVIALNCTMDYIYFED